MWVPSDYCTFKAGIGQGERIRGRGLSQARSGRSGYLLVLASAALFAAAGIAVKVLLRAGYSPLMLAQLRQLWAFLLLLLGLLVARPRLLRVGRRELPGLALFGILGLAGVQAFYYLALARINIALALVLEFLGLIVIAAWERFRRGQAVPGLVWGALGLALAGSFFAAGAYRVALLRVNLPGIGFALAAALLLAFYFLRASTLAGRVDVRTTLVYAFGAGAGAWGVYDLVARPDFPQDPRVMLVMGMIGAGTLAGFGLSILALRTIRPSLAGIVATSEPVFAGIVALLLLGETFEPLQVVGGTLVLASIALVQLGDDERAVPAGPDR